MKQLIERQRNIPISDEIKHLMEETQNKIAENLNFVIPQEEARKNKERENAPIRPKVGKIIIRTKQKDVIRPTETTTPKIQETRSLERGNPAEQFTTFCIQFDGSAPSTPERNPSNCMQITAGVLKPATQATRGMKLVSKVQKTILEEIGESIDLIKKQFDSSFETSAPFFDCDAGKDNCWDVNPFDNMEFTVTASPGSTEQNLKLSLENVHFQKSVQSDLFDWCQPRYNNLTDAEVEELERSVDDTDNYIS